MANEDEVRLVVPATPEFLRLARVTAAGLASRLRFSFDEVEDLRLAVDEVCFGLTGSSGQPGTVEIRFVVGDAGLEIEGRGRFDSGDRRPQLSEISGLILDALVDEHSLGADGDGPWFRVVKQRRPNG